MIGSIQNSAPDWLFLVQIGQMDPDHLVLSWGKAECSLEVVCEMAVAVDAHLGHHFLNAEIRGRQESPRLFHSGISLVLRERHVLYSPE